MTLTERNISIAMACLSFFKIGALLYYAVIEENVKMGTKATMKTVFTPFTILLLVMIIANLGEFIIQALVFSNSFYPMEALKTIRSICDCVGEYSYLIYGLLRADAIVKAVFPRFQPFLKSIRQYVIPIAFVVQAGTRIVSVMLPNKSEKVEIIMLLVHDVSSGINGLLVIFIDTVCFFAFVQFLRRTKMDIDSVDLRFIIISRYGIASVVICTSSFGFSILYGSTKAETWLLVVYLPFSAIVLVLFLMKCALLAERKKTKESLNGKLETG
ncbi:hypothetical protein BCR33DRAFT_23075 [Rhizoclosmatium globosum]|uniref:G-protein coupled receptors family 3 profile domain-containing protein n=1 Tax=Rhizoclosmatium globosum TaxID=329046 RepID=A0A1Y2AYF5_9FUNG|nr:hypothetical protein BCR33DRAFT_23075 [Rhizoclosmatium globosum]|eukprot:ORY27598.1 hypothetical protein BCR33DRAFT_23075 [Rhizoclosmatium globosum]